MKIQLIRNATLRLQYAQQTLLIDPFLGAKHTIESFAGKSPNPLIDLPCPIDDVLADVGAVVVSHLHPDHFDGVAQSSLPKQIEIICQPGDEEAISAFGFQHVTAVDAELAWRGISLARTAGQHGTGEWGQRMGRVSGFILRAAGEPTVYWAGDTIWCEPVMQVIQEQKPDVIVTHSGGAQIADSGPIIMDAQQTIELCQAADFATVVAVHLEALDHCSTSRAELRALAEKNGISPQKLLIPLDGETIRL